MGIENRKNPRRAILWSGTIISGEFDQSCHIWNVSLGGALIKTEKTLPKGTRITLKTEKHGPLQGVIVRSDENSLGVKFDDTPEYIDEIFGEASITLGLKG